MKQNNIETFIVTGKITSGKTHLLASLVPQFEKYTTVEGIISYSSKRKFNSGETADSYRIEIVGQKESLPWAIKSHVGPGYQFNLETQEKVEQKISASLQNDHPEVFILDNVGQLEIEGYGFDKVIREVLSMPIKTTIFSVKKKLIPSFVKKYQIGKYKIIDLDYISHQKAKKIIIENNHGEKIGLYATMTSVVEVGLGSTLNSLRVPLKGTFLASLQNFMLILFGKDLKGKGLFWIVLITSGLKSFSLVGSKLRPMFYIFVQGSLFVLPIKIFGLNYLSILMGSILLGWCTTLLSFIIKYALFGKPFVDAYLAFFHKIFAYLHVSPLTLMQIIAISLILKTLLAIAIATFGHFYNFSKLLEKLKKKVLSIEVRQTDLSIIKSESWIKSAINAIKDILSRRYLLSFVFITLIIYFFTKLSNAQLAMMIIRGLVLSWFGFLVARRINFLKVVSFLERHNLSHVSNAMIKALNIVNSFKQRKLGKDVSV